MLSSVAERVYWLGRYMERVENSARLMDVYSAMLLDLPRESNVGWGILLDIAGCHEQYEEHHTNINENSVVKYLLSDLSNPTSIFSCLKMLRENARTTREIMPAEAWEQINELYLNTKEKITGGVGRKARRELFDDIIADCQRLGGLLSGCMTHNTAFAFVQLGRRLERADMTTRIVDVGSISLLPAFAKFRRDGSFLEPFENVVWMNILRSLSAYQAYRQHVHSRVNGRDVVSYLLQDEEFPRSVNFCLTDINRFLEQLPNHEEVQRAAVRVKRITGEAEVGQLLERGLLDFIEELQISIADIHDELSRTWFGPVVQASPTVPEAAASDKIELKPVSISASAPSDAKPAEATQGDTAPGPAKKSAGKLETKAGKKAGNKKASKTAKKVKADASPKTKPKSKAKVKANAKPKTKAKSG